MSDEATVKVQATEPVSVSQGYAWANAGDIVEVLESDLHAVLQTGLGHLKVVESEVESVVTKIETAVKDEVAKIEGKTPVAPAPAPAPTSVPTAAPTSPASTGE